MVFVWVEGHGYAPIYGHETFLDVPFTFFEMTVLGADY